MANDGTPVVVDYFDGPDIHNREPLSEQDFATWNLNVRDGVTWKADAGDGEVREGCAEDAISRRGLLIGQWADVNEIASECSSKLEDLIRTKSHVSTRKNVGYSLESEDIFYTETPVDPYVGISRRSNKKLQSFLALLDPRWTSKGVIVQKMPPCTKDPGFHDFLNDSKDEHCCGCNRRLLSCFYPPQVDRLNGAAGITLVPRSAKICKPVGSTFDLQWTGTASKVRDTNCFVRNISDEEERNILLHHGDFIFLDTTKWLYQMGTGTVSSTEVVFIDVCVCSCSERSRSEDNEKFLNYQQPSIGYVYGIWNLRYTTAEISSILGFEPVGIPRLICSEDELRSNEHACIPFKESDPGLPHVVECWDSFQGPVYNGVDSSILDVGVIVTLQISTYNEEELQVVPVTVATAEVISLPTLGEPTQKVQVHGNFAASDFTIIVKPVSVRCIDGPPLAFPYQNYQDRSGFLVSTIKDMVPGELYPWDMSHVDIQVFETEPTEEDMAQVVESTAAFHARLPPQGQAQEPTPPETTPPARRTGTRLRRRVSWFTPQTYARRPS